MTTSNGQKLHILIIEDSPSDADLMIVQLENAGYEVEFRRVETAEEMTEALKTGNWDAILSDYSLPHFSAPLALRLLLSTGLDIPFIVVSGTIGEERAVAIMREGAQDFILKEYLRRLIPVIQRELREAASRRARKEMEKENARLISELQEAVRARDEFLSIASHELNTPLTPLRLQIQGFRRLLEREPKPGPIEVRAKRMIETSEHEIERLIHLVSDLLDVARIRTGRLQLKPREIDLTKLVRSTVEGFSVQIAAAKSRISLSADEGICALLDPLRIEQVISNLISNAIKYGGGKPIEVTLRADAGKAVLSVKDHGIGIAAEDLDRIFHRFERVATEPHFTGLGLGLYITQQIIAAVGGTIQVQSELNEGSVFTVEFPLIESKQKQSA